MTRITATVMCQSCPWCAKHTADTALEVAQFLRALLLKHVEETHKEQQ